MRRRLALGGVLAVLAAVVACNDLVAEPVSVGPAGGDGGADVASPIPPDSVTPCPAERVSEDSPCSPITATCEYGSTSDVSCNVTLVCTVDNSEQPYWKPLAKARACSIHECPTGDIASLANQPCDVPSIDGGPPGDADERICGMTDGTCGCTTGVDGNHAHPRMWICTKPNTGCPTTRPLIGQPCGTEEACDYGSCEFKRGLQMECNAGVWQPGAATCN